MTDPRNAGRVRRGALAAVLALAAGQGAWAAQAEDLQPGVQTSSAAAPAQQRPPAATQPAPARRMAPPPPAAATPAAATPAAKQAPGHDRVELDTTQITGNKELPNVMYVVPWKKPELGDFGGRPPKSLLDELLAPVDRDVFRRQNRYFAALQGAAAAGQGAQAPAATKPSPAGDAAGTPAAPKDSDEK